MSLIRRRSPRRVLVTGAASGLGLSLVNRFAAAGDQVLATDIMSERPIQLPDGVEYLRLDVRKQDDWDAARDWVVQQWGAVDVVVNNAGVASGGRFDRISADEWQWIIDINLMGVVRGCQTFTPMFKEQRSGHFVNTASMAGLVFPPAMAAYNAVKAGVVALSETLSYELGAYGITVTAVCPGFFRTNLAESLRKEDSEMGSLAEKLITKSPTTAEAVSKKVLEAIDKRKRVVVIGPDAHLILNAKRYARPLYDLAMSGTGYLIHWRERQAKVKQLESASSTPALDKVK